MSERVRALIVDDEPLARANLRHALGGFPKWSVEAECASATQAREALERAPVDVIFLDIQMPRESGLEFARSLASIPNPPIVVFVTAFEAFAIEAFELHALDYLLKPFDDERFSQTIARAESQMSLQARAAYATALRGYVSDSSEGPPAAARYLSHLSVRSVGRVESVAVREIRWVKAAGNYVELRLADRTLLHRVTLSHLETRLDPAIFIRVHRSALVRREECAALSVEGDGVYALQLRNGDSAPVSETYVDAVRTLLEPR